LNLLPRSYRNKFGEEIQDVFASTVNDAAQRGFVPLMAVALREMRDMPVAVLHAHQLGTHAFAFDHPLRQKIEPVAWHQIALAMMPGVIAMVVQFIKPGENVSAVLTLIQFALPIAALTIALRSPAHRIPVWGLMPLGALLGLGFNAAVTGTIVFFGRSPFAYIAIVLLGVGWLLYSLRAVDTGMRQRLSLIATGLILLPLLTSGGLDYWSLIPLHLTFFVNAIAGLYFARYSGLHAGLFVLGASVGLMYYNIEPAIYFRNALTWSALLQTNLSTLFYILAPIWVLRARSLASQTAGLLLPIGAFLALLAMLLMAVTGMSLARAINIGQPALLLMGAMVYAIVLYMLVWGADGDQSATKTVDL
jgi:hypothetical protein